MSQAWTPRSESAPLKTVLLHRPGPEVSAVKDPAAALYVRAVEHPRISEELAGWESRCAGCRRTRLRATTRAACST